MEEGQNKKIKSAYEKFCSECGEIILLKAEICPKCGVRQLLAPGSAEIVATNYKCGWFGGKLSEKFFSQLESHS